jgi:hypothetical protein
MAKKQRPLLFVDTNIFLDFYRAEGQAGLTLLKHVESVSESLIMTDQVEVEFLNNRQKVISLVLQNLKLPSLPPFIPAYFSESRTAVGIERNQKQIRERIQKLKQRFARVLKDPSIYDPVFKIVKKVTAKNTTLNLKFAGAEKERIVELASQRFQRGFPPRKKQDQSIGDAINWEWILSCSKSAAKDVVLVSRDSDFGLVYDGKGYLNDWLEEEFKEKVSIKRRIELTQSLAQALKRLSVPVTPDEEHEEQALIATHGLGVHGERPITPLPECWPEFLNRLKSKSTFMWSALRKITCASVENSVLILWFEQEFKDNIVLVDNASTHSVIGSILDEVGIKGFRKIRFAAFPEAVATPSEEVSEPGKRDSGDGVPF